MFEFVVYLDGINICRDDGDEEADEDAEEEEEEKEEGEGGVDSACFFMAVFAGTGCFLFFEAEELFGAAGVVQLVGEVSGDK